MKVRMKGRPTGYVSIDGGPLAEWPAVGAVVDFPDGVAEDLIANGNAEKVHIARPTKEPAAEKPAVKEKPEAEKIEQRPVPTAHVEHRGAKKSPNSGA